MVDAVSSQNSASPIQNELERLNNSSLRDEIYRGIFEGYKDDTRDFQSIDVVLNPEKYTAEQKLITLLDLLEAKEKYDKYRELPKRFSEKPLNEDEIVKDLNNAIAVLQDDAETLSLLTQKVFEGFHHILSTGDRVAPDTETDAAKVLDNTITRDREIEALRDVLTSSFKEEVVEGGILKDGLAAGKDIQTILQDYNSALALYMAVLPGEVITVATERLQSVYAEFYQKEVLPRLPDLGDALDGLTRGAGSVTPQIHDSLINSEVFGANLFDPDLFSQLSDYAAGQNRTVSGRAIPQVSDLEALFQSGLFDISSMRRLLTEKHLTRTDKPIPSIEAVAGEAIGLISGNYLGAGKETFRPDLVDLFRELWGDFVELDGGDVRGLDGAIDRYFLRTGIGGEKAQSLRDGVKMLFNGASLASKIARDRGMSPAEISALVVMCTKLAGDYMAETGVTSGLRTQATRDVSNFRLQTWDQSLRENHSLDVLDKTGNILKAFVKAGDSDAIVFGPALEPGGAASLFSSATSIMAENLFGASADQAFARQTFASDVLTVLESLWDKVSRGEVSAFDLPGHLERLTSHMNTPQGSDIGVGAYREGVAQAVTALLRAGALVSRVQPKSLDQDLVYRGTDGKFHRRTGLNTYTTQEVSALIAIAVGLAGRGIAEGGSTHSLLRGDRSDGSSGQLAEKLFATQDNGWDVAVFGAYDRNTVKEMAEKVTDLVRDRAPDLDIGNPSAFAENTSSLEDILGDTVNSMASSFFGENVEDAARFKTNAMSIIYYVWSFSRPGGVTDGLASQLIKTAVDSRVTQAPTNMTLSEYKDTIVRSVNALMYSARTAYAGFNLVPGDKLGLSALILYGASAGVNLAQTVSEGLKASANLPNSKLTEWAKVARKDAAEMIKLGVNVSNALIFTAWLPLEVLWLLQDIKKGDPVKIALLSVGVAADVVIAGEAIVGAGLALANLINRVATMGAIGLSGSAGIFTLSSAWSLTFGIANLASAVAWMAYSVYQGIKNKSAFKSQTREMEATLKRLVDDPIKFARGFQFGPIKVGDLDRHEATPVDWDSVIERQKNRA